MRGRNRLGVQRGDLRSGNKLHDSTASLRPHIPHSHLARCSPRFNNRPRDSSRTCEYDDLALLRERGDTRARLRLRRGQKHADTHLETRTVPSNPDVTILSSSNSSPATASRWSPTLHTWFQVSGMRARVRQLGASTRT